ncbi:DUF3592 domain-containing protein [Streptomyces sp. NPDC003635]
MAVKVLVGALLCAGASLLLFGAAWRDALLARRLRRAGVRVRGWVVANKRVHDEDQHYWVPVIAFRDDSGTRQTFSPRMRGTGLALATGREVPVVYLERRPETARLDLWWHMTGMWVLLLAGGAVFLCAGVLIVVLAS